jgi:4-hydroxybutyrate dehydrogenase
MADKREIVIVPTIYKFQNFGEMAKEFNLGARDVVLTNEFIYTPYMKDLGLKCNFVFQEKFGAGEPSEAMIKTMYDAIPYESYDRVIAVGGGAIMDLCKLLGCKRPDTVHNLYFKRFPVQHEKDVIAIPTTCGTGSECTNISVAIVKDEKDGVLTGGETKLGLVSDDIIPNKVCLIPDLIRTLPYKPFACSAIDALIHATESFLSPHRKTMTSELFSEKAMDMILKGFKRIGEKGPDARFEYLDEFVTASLYAGIAFLKAGCATVHAMSFPLGGTYHVPHGESNYMLFGEILKVYDERKPDGELKKFKELVARILECRVDDAIPTLNALLQKILPLRPLHEAGFKEEDIVGFPKSVEVNQQRLLTNSYVPMDLPTMERIYRNCF